MNHSPSSIDYSNQKDFYDPRYHGGSITIVGAGGIGSHSVMALARLGIPKMVIFDDDVVESRNVASQAYSKEDIDQSKAETIVIAAENVSNGTFHANKKRITADNSLSGEIVISAVDSMKSRKAIFEAAQKSPSVKYLIDGRLGGQLIVLHVVDLSDKDHVEYYTSPDIMFDDSESESNSCTARAVCDVGYAVSALITRNVRRILTGQTVEKMQILNMESLSLNVDM